MQISVHMQGWVQTLELAHLKEEFTAEITAMRTSVHMQSRVWIVNWPI